MSRVACLIPSGRFSGTAAPLNNSIYIAKPIFSLLGRRDSFHPAGDSPIIADDAVTQPLSQTADLPSQMISYDYLGLDEDFQVPQRLASSASQPCGLCVLIWSQNLPLNTFYLLLSPAMPDQVHHKPEARNAKSKRSQILWLLLPNHRLTFARTRFLEQRAAGIALPSTTQPEV